MATDLHSRDDRAVNWPLLDDLKWRPHRLLHIADDLDVPTGVAEVLNEARTAHHLLDLIGVETAADSTPSLDVDARVYLAAVQIIDLRERLDRIAAWHSRETGPAGMVGLYCNECNARHPCPTAKLAKGEEVADAN